MHQCRTIGCHNALSDPAMNASNFCGECEDNFEVLNGFHAPSGSSPEKLTTAPTHNHYFKDISHLSVIDPYRLLLLYEVTDPALQHITKKALCAGLRGHKDFRRDLQDIIDTTQRRLAMLEEDGERSR